MYFHMFTTYDFHDCLYCCCIGLARALYRDAAVILLDNPLSAVDSKVGKLIFYSAIQELAVNRGKCVVLGE